MEGRDVLFFVRPTFDSCSLADEPEAPVVFENHSLEENLAVARTLEEERRPGFSHVVAHGDVAKHELGSGPSDEMDGIVTGSAGAAEGQSFEKNGAWLVAGHLLYR